VSWEEGKEAGLALTNLPEWANQCYSTWMFNGIDTSDYNNTLIITHGWERSGRIILRPKTGKVADTLKRIAPLMSYSGVSSEQKAATIALLFYRLFDLLERVQPGQREWS
jgi:hypothetical protein